MDRPQPQPAPAAKVMPSKAATAKPAPTMSNEAVAARTGKTWSAWFEILDAAGGSGLERREIITLLGEHDVGPVWRAMVASGYERHLGRGEPPKPVAVVKKAAAGNLSTSVTRTVSATQLAAYGAWERPTRRKRFFTEEITFATRADGKTLRFGWKPDASRVSIVFKPLSKTRTQVTISHDKLKNAADVDRLNTYWTETLDRMQALLEKTDD